MESLLISLVSVALIIITMVTMTMNVFSAAVTVTDSWSKMEQSVEEIRRTSIIVTPLDNYIGGNIILLVGNNGQTDLGDFSKWDIMAEYQTGKVQYLDYTADAIPAENQWSLQGIYMTSNISVREVFDYNILNPWETAVLTINLSPEIEAGTYGRVTVSTVNGVTSQCIFSRP